MIPEPHILERRRIACDVVTGEQGVARQDGDAVLRRGERLDAGERGAARPGAGALQLVAGTAGEQPHAAAVGELERPAQGLAGVVAAVRRAGYLAATTTRMGYATPRDRFRLARVQVSRGLSAADLLRRLRTLRPRQPSAPA